MLKFAAAIAAALFLSFSAAAADNIIFKVYQTLNADYINRADNREITLKGLKALQATDPSLKVVASGNKLYLYRRKQVLQSFPLPADDAVAEHWAALSEKVIATAAGYSSQVELHDFEMSDRFAESVFKGLDGYSHYYGAFSAMSDDGVSWRRQFAVRHQDDVVLIKILSFQQNVSGRVKEAIAACGETCAGAVLDLRGNHGGIFNEALEIADLFLDEGIITYTAGKDGTVPQFYTATAGDVLNNKPLVILVDGYTASAAEVLAAALSEQNRAVLIGTKTYGKGTVQDVVAMESGRAMALTTAYFYAPSGTAIDKNGLTPSVCTGGRTTRSLRTEGSCAKADRFNEAFDEQMALKFIKNEL